MKQVLCAGRYLQLVDADSWEYAERVGVSGVVAVLAVTADRRLILTEQYRPPVRARVIDLPAGLAGDVAGQEAEDLEAAARRELEEETGFTVASLERLAVLPTSPGLTSETIHLFRAGEVALIGDGGGDESEAIDVHVVPLENIGDWLDAATSDGRLIDPKVYAALWWSEKLK